MKQLGEFGMDSGRTFLKHYLFGLKFLTGSTITTSTFEKTMNLYLYIPPLSSHPLAA
jgi:hypothetical protein